MMKGIRYLVFLILPLWFAPFNRAQAQSSNTPALNWLRAGLTEKDIAKKIAAYEKALALDSSLVEAMYNLSLAYKKQQNYALTEKWLVRAAAAKPEKLSAELKQQILFELGRTYKKQGRLRDSEATLQSAKTVAVDRATRAGILFELGRCLYEQGRYEEALVELRDGRRLNDNAENFQNFITLVEKAQESKRLQLAAEEAVRQGNTQQARSFVEELQRQELDPQKSELLAAKVDSLVKFETNQRVLTALYEQAQKETAAGNLAAAITTYEALLQQNAAYKDAPARLETIRQQLATQQTQAKLEEDYTAGTTALREKNWTAAILAFEKILQTDENFREARQRLAEAERALENESTETIVARYYVDGVAALNRDDVGSALAALERVRRLNPRYRNTTELLAQIEQRLQQQPQPAAPAPVASNLIENLYQEALTARAQENWMQSVVALEKLQLLQPNYRDAVTLLAESRAQLVLAGKNTLTRGPAGNSLLSISGMLAAIVGLPLIGYVAFSATARARLHLLRGNLLAAAQIYEKILLRHPERVRLYPILANLYLLMRRQDEQAMKIYKAILNLNIATQKREEINALVAQNFLTEGRTDSDAIAVLENALKVERRKQNYPNTLGNA